MSVKLRFVSSGDGGGFTRSRSFAGFSTVQGRRIPNSLSRSSVRSKISVKSSKLYPSLRKGTISLEPQPQQVKKVYEALKRGLIEYLDVHQTHLDCLTNQQKDMKRNSRLAYFYDLDKIEELYETYCIQWRLRDGACNMKHAFSLHPTTKASRESLIELYRNFQECTEDMCLIEGALEVHLGEFHIKMKGLVGYARLCSGDQYEVLVRLGRSRWKLKGKIETDDSQIWDEEERIFIPNLHENFEIKVIELRGLTTVLVGAVTCDSANFFTTQPRIIIVDVTELGTIKLQLEVTWNPFDNDKLMLSAGATPKFTLGNRKASLYNWTPPNTPYFKEKYNCSLLQSNLENASSSIPTEAPTTCILSYLNDGDFDVHVRCKCHNNSRSNIDTINLDSKSTDTAKNKNTKSDQGTVKCSSSPEILTGKSQPESVQQPASHATLDILRETPIHYGARQAIEPTKLDFVEKTGGSVRHRLKVRSIGVENTISGNQKNLLNTKNGGSMNGKAHLTEKQLDEVLNLLKPHIQGQTKLQELKHHVLSLKDKLEPKASSHIQSSMESLMVEKVLESFDFLNTDFSADELSLFGSVRTHSKSYTTYDGALESFGCSVKSSCKELTIGNDDLDVLLMIHMQICKALLKKLILPNIARIVQNSVLEELSWQSQVLETLSVLSFHKAGNICIEETLPMTKRIKHLLKIWRQCTESESILYCSSERFLNQLKRIFMSKIRGKYPGQLETVFRRLLEQIVSMGLLTSPDLSDELVTFFQFHGYLQKNDTNDLERHLAVLTKEVTLIDELQLPGRLKKIKKLKGKRVSQLQPLPQTLQLLAALQLDENHKVCKAVTCCISKSARNKKFRQKAVLYYTDVLSDSDTQVQQAACLALKNLKGTESIDQLASLCQSEVEEVRNAARETILSFGEKGRSVFEELDKMACDVKKDPLSQDADVEITVF
uniref:RIPOR family member 3 isoform X2 n=1 Tax=Geotrypetes seraphini TaxID=260995 RepID=A0A6P8N6B0_GEOSA|nr:RIPOR family member 3 isoform X2 [Geotrypetes seraphini]